MFQQWEDVVEMYDLYAEHCGFSTRLGTIKRKKGAITHHYIVCSNHGKPHSQNRNFDTLNETSLKIRQSTFRVCDCKACICVKFDQTSRGWVLYHFEENHYHPMVPVHSRDLTKRRRSLDFFTKEFIHRASLSKVGPSVAHRLQVNLRRGGNHNVKGTADNFRNFASRVRMFIGDRDTHLVIENMKDQVDHLPNYTFKYSMENGEIRHMFWADEISKINYQVFGNVLAFDATYQTNKYNLIFVPFTGIDNNKRCVTFGAGLLFCETIEAYTWLLKAFLEAHNKQPTPVLTDQDPALRQAVAAVFDRSLHRLCMWHIMKKLTSKIAGEVAHNSEFRAAIHKLVWNIYIKPETFERRWGKLLEKYGLEDHEWLRDM
ncbi:protein FAR1-RELATED SEQUENCE 5-like [Helianthus annuus]|uniref:protein FAR1-RELATED SEQUENCE 5-like n=1 Tax=Helianthus annuus TaxID=4232 RepID=UPI000B8F3F05|nr:protein FAR1-RELATED SEQUENCE 5-like [Helianthus annuus]